MNQRSLSPAGAALSLLLLTLMACGGRVPEPASPSSGESCCREFDYLLEATILKIDVARLHLRLDMQTAQTIASMVSAKSRTRELESAVTEVLMNTPEAYARLTFLMKISAQQFLESTERTLRGIGEEGLLSSPQVEDLIRSSHQHFEFLEDTGIAAGDYIEQVLGGDSVTTTFVTLDGQQRLRAVQVGRQHRIALLGSYFAKSSDFRSGLLDQVFGVN